MNRSLQIAVADDELDMREYFQETLPLMGHQVASLASTGRELVEQCATTPPDMIITDIKMPDLDGIEAAGRIYRRQPVPVILVSAYHESKLLERAEASHVLAYLLKPVRQEDLDAAIRIAMRRFEQLQALHKEANELRQALEDRKLIERAKGVLMKQTGLDEQPAFRRLQQLARRHNRKLVDYARVILLAAEALDLGEGVEPEA